MSKEDKATRYVQDKMFPHIVNAVSMSEKACFTQNDLKQAYEKGYDEGYSEGRKETLLDELKKNIDEEAIIFCKMKQEEVWDKIKHLFTFDEILEANKDVLKRLKNK